MAAGPQSGTDLLTSLTAKTTSKQRFNLVRVQASSIALPSQSTFLRAQLLIMARMSPGSRVPGSSFCALMTKRKDDGDLIF